MCQDSDVWGIYYDVQLLVVLQCYNYRTERPEDYTQHAHCIFDVVGSKEIYQRIYVTININILIDHPPSKEGNVSKGLDGSVDCKDNNSSSRESNGFVL